MGVGGVGGGGGVGGLVSDNEGDAVHLIRGATFCWFQARPRMEVVSEAQHISSRWYSWSPLCRTRLSRTPRYLEQNRISLGFTLVFSIIYYGLSRTPRDLEPFLAPLSSTLRLSRNLLRSEETLVNISQEVQWRHLLTRCILKAEKRIDVFTVTKAKFRLTGRSRWQVAGTVWSIVAGCLSNLLQSTLSKG